MHHDDSQVDKPSLADEDQMTETAVLLCVLDLHPAQMTDSELARELIRDSQRLGERDQVDRAVKRLTGVGLLRRQGDAVVATRAAQYVKALELI
jgi:hypothetical protein